MTRKDLTKDYAKKIAAEIRRAFNYFRETDENDIRFYIEKKMKKLWEALENQCAEEMSTDDGVVVGYPISVGLGGEEYGDVVRGGKTYIYENIQVLKLVVNEEGFQYILKSFDYYHLRGSKSLEDDVYDNYKYVKVKLEDIDKTKIGRMLM